MLEARNRIGGRIHTVERGLDLGPTWFWSENKHVKEILTLLGIDSFEQYETGDHIFQPSLHAPIERFPSDAATTLPSYRFAGGTMSLVHALKDQLPDDIIHYQQVVQSIQVFPKMVQATMVSHGKHLTLLLPCRLI